MHFKDSYIIGYGFFNVGSNGYLYGLNTLDVIEAYVLICF